MTPLSPGNQTAIRQLLLAVPFALALSLAGDAVANGPTPIEITAIGPGPVRVRLANGTTFPCDSADNRRLVELKLNPGEVLRMHSAEHCVCFQQTFQPFIDIDWNASSLVCRPQICKGRGRGRHCVPAPDPTIRLQLSSARK